MYAEICENTATVHRKLTMASFFAPSVITRKWATRIRPHDGSLNGRLTLAKPVIFANCKTVTTSVRRKCVRRELPSTKICDILVSGGEDGSTPSNPDHAVS